jgi:hypothetical protein
VIEPSIPKEDQDRYVTILKPLQLPPEALARVVAWLPGRIAEVEELRREKSARLSSSQLHRMLSKIENAAMALEHLIENLTRGSMFAHEYALIQRDLFTEVGFAEAYMVAANAVRRDFAGVSNIKRRAAMMKNTLQIEQSSGNALRPEVAHLTNVLSAFWRRQLAPPKSNVTLHRFAKAIFQSARLSVGEKAVAKRLLSVQQNKEDTESPIAVNATLVDHKDRRRRNFIDALVAKGFDEESAIEIVDMPNYSDGNWDLDLGQAAGLEANEIVKQAKKVKIRKPRAKQRKSLRTPPKVSASQRKANKTRRKDGR